MNSFHTLVRGERTGPLAVAARAGLWWARLPYAVGVWARNRRYDRHPARAARVPVPVVCVGNLTLGGTGKTVCVEYVARHFRDLDRSVVVLSRGYGSADGGPNDEALVLEENLPDVPHLQGADRTALAHTAVDELECEVLVLDDGFQHRRLHRDLDVVLLDATRPLADEYLFPRGLLREPVSGLRRAGFVLFTRCDQATPESLTLQREWLRKRFPDLPVGLTTHRPVGLVGPDGETDGVDELRGRPVAAFCGIGNPEAFRRTLTDLGADVIDTRTYADHHSYNRTDISDLDTWAMRLPTDATVVTTQKDWVKIRLGEIGGRPLRAVRVGLAFRDGEEAFRATLTGVLPAGDTPPDFTESDG